ncbi:MAG: hypothetical protein KatS3mg022_3191 [Armatimonadota bacterium]|nr:MAG: hypothetical protein KatS3mg022_3191 [Armatimonadota bacterium]
MEGERPVKNLLSCGDVAEMLGVTRQRVHILRLTGKLRGTRLRSGWVYRRDEVERYQQQREAWLRKRGRRNENRR